MITIIEDCFPYYVKFKHPSLISIQQYLGNNFYNITESWNVSNAVLDRHEFTQEDSKKILSFLTLDKDLPSYDDSRLSIWQTPPNGYRYAHKDGMKNGVSINIPVSISDELCYSSWYTDESLQNCSSKIIHINFQGKQGGFRESIGFNFETYQPVKKMSMKEDEFVLFNSNIWHSVDNRLSNNSRSIISVRFTNSENITFHDIYMILFKEFLLTG